ncbi:MAG TPA: hypothetical protein DCS55_21855 [Acidimicrobiaceae bacterium]|nr:hypothetical protein [Acidimicrobiaceae bacterium]
MRFTITPLGSTGGRTVGQVVDDIVRYLEPRAAASSIGSPGVPEGDGPSSYYADRGTEPGRWIGYGAKEALLAGSVDPADFARVMAGRDPHTGARLITAQGSAGRRPTLGAGTTTRLGVNGLPLFDADDTAAALGMTKQEAGALIVAGERAAFGALLTALTGQPLPVEPDAARAAPVIDADGNRWITQAELDRVDEARSRGVAPDTVAAAGAPDDQLSIAQATRLSGLTSRYLRSLCRRYEDHRAEIDTAVAEGRKPRRAYLVGYRGTKNQWLVTRENLVAYLHRRVAPAVRVGYDLTLTTEKSLGVLALLGDDDTRATVLDAIEAGNDRGLHHLEYRVLSARAKGHQVGTRGWTVASFRHLTSRALDPFPHHHNVVANTVIDEHGTRRAIDARHLYWHAQEASALATAEMRHLLTETLGVRWRPSRHGGWEIDGIDDDLVREFSQRRGEIDDAITELEEAIGRRTNLDEVQAVITSTRPDKTHVDPSELVAGWWRRARSHGLTPEDLNGVTGRAGAAQHVERARVFEQLVDPETGLCASSSIFTRSDVIAALVDLPVPTDAGVDQPLLLRADDLERLADEFLAHDEVIPLEPVDLPRSSALARAELFSTREILTVQQRILDHFAHGHPAPSAFVPASILAAATAANPRLTDEQRSLVTSFCQSGRRVQCAIGRAGTGKTTTMRTAATAWIAAGHRVIGTAVKGEAARHLAEGAGIPTETVAWFLARRDRPSLPLDDRTVLIIDEASTLSDRDLDALLTIAAERGATVRLVGDPAQHGAVSAGGMFRHLCELHADQTPELTTTHRLTDPTERRAVDALRRGDIDSALEQLETAGRLHIADDEIGLYVGMLQRWWTAHLDGDDHPMVDRRHHTRRQLNRLARQLRRAHGELGGAELSATGERHFAAGDRVVARMAARHLHVPDHQDRYLRNGATGTVTEAVPGRVPAGDRLRIDFDGIGPIDVPRQFFDEHDGPGGRRDVGIDHAYAVTSYAVQGATYDSSTSRIDEHASRSEAYVDLTRGRHANHLYLTRGPESPDGEHLPKVPPPPVVDAVSNRLRASGPERPAVEIDPSAAQFTAATSEISPGPRVEPRRARRMAIHQPDDDLVHHFSRVPSVPFLVRRRDDLVASVSAFRHIWQVAPTGHESFAWALGAMARCTDVANRTDLAERIVGMTLSAAAEELRRHQGSELPPWAPHHLRLVAARGGRLGVADLSHLYDRIESYRRERGVDHLDDAAPEEALVALLGPPPLDPAERAAYVLLAEDIRRTAQTTTLDQARGIA